MAITEWGGRGSIPRRPVVDDMGEKEIFICDDCGEEFHISEEADDGVCDWCWMVAGA